jgi:hypothetical protein
MNMVQNKSKSGIEVPSDTAWVTACRRSRESVQVRP